MKRPILLKIFFLGFATLLVGRAIQLQVFPDPRLAKLAHRQFNSKVSSLPRRGYVFDRNGEGLAISLKVHSLFFRPEIAKKELTRSERNRILFNLSKVLHIPVQQLVQKMQTDRGFVWVKRQLSEHEEKSIRNLGLLEYGDAVGLAEETKRFYPNKELASHILGSVNVDGQGLEGLEYLYDGILGGEQSRVSSNRDAMGRRIFQDDKGLLAIKDGQSLVLTIDKAIQYEAEKVLKSSIDGYDAKAGTIIVAEVASGEILAMANYPTYNPNLPRNFPADHKRNRAITDTYEPGSTFKPFVVGYALEKGKTPKSKIYCEKGSFTVGDRKISEATANEKFEWLTLGEILKFSSNVGAAKLALELGSNNIAQLSDRIGIGHKTNIDLPGEVSGSLDAKELKSAVRLANVGFGHGLAVTPLQILSLYLAIANDGTWIQPKLVKAILSEDPESIEKGNIRFKLGHRFDQIKTKKIFSQSQAHELKKMLATVTEEKGTATAAQLEEWPVAGKTGTAQKIDPKTKKYSRNKYIVSFAGFAPVADPKLVALVVLDEPQIKKMAGETAAPTFKEVMRAALLREKIPPVDYSLRIQQLANRSSIDSLSNESKEKQPLPSSESVSAIAKPSMKIELNEDKTEVKIPNLSGLSIREVSRVIGDLPLDCEYIGQGVLVSQNIATNEWIPIHSKIKFVFE